MPIEKPPDDAARWVALLDREPEALRSVSIWARCCGVPTTRLRRQLRATLGETPSRILDGARVRLAARLRARTDLDAARILTLAGAAPAPAVPTRERAEGPLRVWLPARQPFPHHSLQAFLARRALRGIETPAAGEAFDYVRTLRAAPGHGVLRIGLRLTDAGVTLEVRGRGRVPLRSLLARVQGLLDLDAPAASIDAHLRTDALLAPQVEAVPGRRIPGTWDPFELMVRAILGQQVSIAAACTHAAHLVGLCAAPAGCFPTAEEVARADLAALRMPASRRDTLTRVARAVADGELDPGGAVAELRTKLLAIRGIGPWTAEYVAMRAGRDADAFPASDLIVRQALAVDGILPTPAAASARAEAWRPWRAYAVPHLWARAGGG
ncbi:MAG: AlkA N-terminal domain-containing protein [Pseudomonadales bacterium]|jgi:AraC family transcriptional regulator of adaptative response / DNA-3-methyladenine glycosylase II|nr:AlkA N-terminal domain-containing protein [Pseudomonadales bacterium]